MKGLNGLRASSLLIFAVLITAPACGRTNPTAHASPAVSASPASPSPTPQALATVPGCPSGKRVTTESELGLALSTATPGAVIVMAAGTYGGQFVAQASGTQDAPISLCGTRAAVIDGGDTTAGYALYLSGASWWRLVGFTVEGAQKGVVVDHGTHDLISGLYVHDVGDEAIHLRSFSTDNTVDGNVIRRTGLLKPKFGEGIYVGSANSNWCKYTACNPDASDRNIISNNDISQTMAENIDIKEGTTGGSIIANHLSGLGMDPTGASAWVNVKGNGWTVSGNVGQTSVNDGFQVHEVYAGWGLNNVFHQNQAVVNGPGYGFYSQHHSLGTVVTCDNTASGAAKGLSNISCTP